MTKQVLRYAARKHGRTIAMCEAALKARCTVYIVCRTYEHGHYILATISHRWPEMLMRCTIHSNDRSRWIMVQPCAE